MLPSEIPKLPHRLASERISWCLETSPPSWLAPWDRSPTLTHLSLFLSCIFCPTPFWREWAAFLGAWCPLPAFGSCFVEVAQNSNELLINLWGRKWSPCPIPWHLMTFPPVRGFQCPQFSSVHFNLSVLSDFLQPRALHHARLPCLSPTPGMYSISCPLSQWCHPIISVSIVPFSSYLQSFPASGSFQMNQLFASGGLRFGVSASTSVLLMNIQDWFP